MRSSLESIIEKANIVHDYKYDYSHSKYNGYHNTIDILCSEHGIFSQRVKHHLSGSGCPECGTKITKDKNSYKWTELEKELLSELYKSKSIRECSKILNKSFQTIVKQLKFLKLWNPRIIEDFKINRRKWISLKNSARIRGIKVEITPEDIWKQYLKQRKKCALTGRKIYFDKESSIKTTASIDRIDSTKHYNIDNIQIVHKEVNRNKLDSKESDFFKLCKEVYFNCKNQYEKRELIWEDDISHDTIKPKYVEISSIS